MKPLSSFQLIVIICIFLNIENQILAQGTWEKIYSDYSGDLNKLRDAAIDIHYNPVDSTYTFLGLSHSQGGNMSIYKIDFFGNLIFRNYYSGFGSSHQNLRFLNSSSGVILSDTEPISTFVAYKTLIKLDSVYNITWKYQYGIDIGASQSGLLETSNHDFLIAENTIIGSNIPVLIKIDSSGAMIWAKVYKDFPGLPRTLIETMDGNYIVGINSIQGKGIGLCKTDTAGVVIWSKSYLRPNGVIASLIEKPNGNLIISGSTDTTVQTPYSFLFITEVDSMGNTLWAKIYGDSNFQLNKFYTSSAWDYWPIKMEITLDGGLIILTTCRIQGGNNRDIVIIKTDNAGNIEWEKRHGDPINYEMGVDLISTPENGYFIVSAFYQDMFSLGYYLLKTDSLGSVGCNEYSDLIPMSSILPTDSNFVVVDSLISIGRYTAMAHDTILDPPDTLPTCNPNTISTNILEGIKVIVYPNPSTGFFHLDLSSTEGKDVFVYDLMGKVIFSRRNVLEAALDIDLSVNAKGIYLLTVTAYTGRATAKVVLY